MEFPVDVLENTSHGELERSAHSYMNELLYTDPDHSHYFTLPTGKKVQISLSSVGFVPLYGANLQHKVLALFTPQDQLTAVALFLANQWYSVEDILKSANLRREGLFKVRSVGERIVLYVLNRIIYRTNEMGSGEVPFLCHSENDYAKILWKNGQAVGFYSVKPKGSVCNNSLRQCYFLPVMDSIYVRKAHRGKGYGLQMLEDFVDSFNEDELGLRYPLSPAMTNVCRHYLDRYPADVDLFWEVEGVGGLYQRTRVAYKLTCRSLNDTHKDGHGEDNGQNGDIVEPEGEELEDTSLNITEEVIVVNKHHKLTEEVDTPISMHTRSSEHRRRKRGRDEEEAKGLDSQPEKINRMEMAEEEMKEFIPADGVSVESVPEDPTETLVPTVEVNGKQAEDKEEVKEGEKEMDESTIQNKTCNDEEKGMEVEEEGHKVPVQKTVDTPEEPAAEQQEAAPVADNQEMDVDIRAHLQQQNKDAPAAEKLVENEQKQLDTEVVSAAENPEVSSAVEEKQVVSSAAEENHEVPPKVDENQEVTPAAEDQQEVASGPEEKNEVAPANEDEEMVAPVPEEQTLGAPAAKEVQEEVKEKQDEAAVAMEEQDASSVEKVQEVAPEMKETEVDPATEEKQKGTPEIPKNKISSGGEKEQEVSPEPEDDKVEKQKVDSAEETSSLAVDAEGEQGEEEDMDVVNDTDEVTDTSEQSSREEESQSSEEKENNTVMKEEAAQKEDEDEEEQEKNLNVTSDFSMVRRAKTKLVPPSSKRSSKRLSKMTLEDEEDEQGQAKAVEDDKGMSTEEEKVSTEEEAEHSSEEEEQAQDPPVIDKRVLRGKTKVIQTAQRTRSKRRGKM